MAARVKSKKVALGGQSSEINDQFQQILGNGPLDPEIVTPKLLEIHEHTNLIISVLRSLYDVVRKASPGSESQLESLERSRYRWKEYLQENFTENPELIDEKYKSLKTSFVVDDIITLYGDLKPYEKYIEENDGSFIEDAPGDTFEVFTGCKLNIKEIFLYAHDDEDAKTKIQHYVLKCFSLLLKASRSVYKLVTSPDIDISSVSEFLVNALVDVKKHIPRCDRAFKEIEKSIGQLEDNFSNYYKDYLETGSQIVIMENFINDIIKNTKGDLQLTRQFREIIKFLRSKVQKSKTPNDPKLRKIFDEIDAFDRKVSKK